MASDSLDVRLVNRLASEADARASLHLRSFLMSSYLYRIASFAYRRRRLVLGLWLVAAIAAIAIAQASGGKTNDTFSIPGTESQNAAAVLTAKLPAFSGGQTSIVFPTANGTGTAHGTGTAKGTGAAGKTAPRAALARPQRCA